MKIFKKNFDYLVLPRFTKSLASFLVRLQIRFFESESDALLSSPSMALDKLY